MTTTWRHRNRPPPAVNETLYAQRLDNYLHGAQHHPTIAHVMAYEDSIINTNTINGAPHEAGTNHRTHIQPREPHLPT